MEREEPFPDVIENLHKDFQKIKDLNSEFFHRSQYLQALHQLNKVNRTHLKKALITRNFPQIPRIPENVFKIYPDFLVLNKARLERRIGRLHQSIKINMEELSAMQSQLTERFNQFDTPTLKILHMKADPHLKDFYNIDGKIYGAISELIKVKEEYKTAVLSAIKEHLETIIVDDQKTVNQCINYLRENSLGRASFIPLKDIKRQPFNLHLNTSKSILGTALDFIEYDKRFKSVMEYFFGRIIVVKDINTALHYEVNATRVTLDGQVVEPSNLIHGGISYDDEQKNKIKYIENKLHVLQNSISKLKEKRIKTIRKLRDIYQLEKSIFVS